MKTSRFGSRLGYCFRKASRAATTSSRSCSAARTLFKRQLEVAEKAKDRRLAHLHIFLRQASSKLRERAIRLLRHKRLYQIRMRCQGKCLVPAKFGWTDTAGVALTFDEPANGAQSQGVLLGHFLAGKAGFESATTRSARSSEYGFASHHWPPCPSGNLESDSSPFAGPVLSASPLGLRPMGRRRRSFWPPERAISSARACTRLMRAMPRMLIGYAQYASLLGKDRGKITQMNKPEAYKLNLWRQF
jgi:hypothetical protein